LVHDTKTGKNVPNEHKKYQMISSQMSVNIPNGHKIYHFFLPKALQNFPNWDFWFKNKPSGTPGLQVKGDNPNLR
jgi:hypothetical protein